jgi:hypothetical protein
MARAVTEYRCLLISPSDVHDERDAISAVVDHWNAQLGSALGARIHLVRWETHAVPDIGAPPQEVLNQQIVDDCDFAVAVFWTRIGTPTSDHQSGSIEEIERLRTRGARVLLYFSTAPVPQESLRDDQFQRLQEFKSRLQSDGLLGVFNSTGHLREQVLLHLTGVVSALLERDRGQPSPAETGQMVLTAPRPDLRVLVSTVVLAPSSPRQQYIRVSVQNHSPVVVFVSSVSIATRSGTRLLPPRDAYTGEHQSRRPLRPGESHSMLLDGHELIKRSPPSDVVCAVVTDDIGREYRSSEEEMRTAMEEFAATDHRG